MNFNLWQSKNGGLAAWEPAGTQEWLEVSYFVILFFFFSFFDDSLKVNFNECSLANDIQSWNSNSSQVLNPTEFFADIVIEHEYVECTSSAIHALVLFKKLYPGHRKKEIENFTSNAVRYLEDVQSLEGGWYIIN